MSDLANTDLAHSLRLLFTRRFGTFWFASLLSNIGTWAQQVAEPWLLLSLGASSFLLGLDTFALGAPVMLLTLIGGALADHTDRRRVIALFQSIQMMCPALIVVLLLAGAIKPWMVILLSLIVGITDALSMPSFQTIVSSIVEREQIPTGILLNSTQFNLSRILGPAVAGVLMASMGAVGAFAVNAASYLPFIFIALWVFPRPKKVARAEGPALHRQLKSGVRAVLNDPLLRGALMTVLASSLLCAPVITFCPVLIKEIFHGGIGHFSLTVGSFGLGGLLGAISLLAADPNRDRRPWCSWFALLFGGTVVLSAMTRWQWTLPVLFLLAGAAMTASNTSANTLLQTYSSQQIRGQSVSLFMLAMRGGIALGSLLTGLTIGWLGIRYALLLNGLLAVVIQLLIRQNWLHATAIVQAESP